MGFVGNKAAITNIRLLGSEKVDKFHREKDEKENSYYRNIKRMTITNTTVWKKSWKGQQ